MGVVESELHKGRDSRIMKREVLGLLCMGSVVLASKHLL